MLSNMKLPQIQAQYLYDNGTQLMDCTFPKPEDLHEGNEDFFVILHLCQLWIPQYRTLCTGRTLTGRRC